MDFMILATELNWIGKLIYNNLYDWVQGWGSGYELIGAFGITVILFTLFLKLITLPMDFWQKLLARKNTQKMEIMKPELDRINKQCGENKQLQMQKQRELYKRHKYSAFSACLPTIVTLAIFLIVFGGFNSAVRYHNSVVFDNLNEVYETAYAAELANIESDNVSGEEKIAQATAAAESAVLNAYKPEKFFLTTNIFMPDTWKNPIPDVSTYSGTGMGKLGITEMTSTQYNKVMNPIIKKYNYTDSGKSKWNGYLILPIIAFALSVLSTKLIKPADQPAIAGQTEEQIKAQKSQAKMMTFIMPLMMGVFSLFYSTAFTLYMVVSNVFTTLFNLGFNIIIKQIDAKKKEQMLSTTIKK